MSYDSETNKKYLKEYYKKQRQEMLNFLGNKCAKCGTTENLEFDHVDWKTKSFSVGKLWSKKYMVEVYKELGKCQLLCNEHHKEKTKQDKLEINKLKTFTHGTHYAWLKKKCICAVCYTAKRLWHRKRNTARRKGSGYKERF